jgi:branched-chain amino acid transport system substrate-binding protein
MSKTSKIVIGVVVVVIILLLTSSSKNNDSVKIVALYPLTGGVASWGESSQKSTQLAVEEINTNGGINGSKLEVIYEDHKCEPKTALSLFQKNVPNVKIFTSSSCSGTVLSIAPLLKENDAVLLATIAASSKISSASPLLFRNWAVESRQSALIGQKMKELALKKVGVIYEETDYGKGLKVALDDYLKDSGIEIIAESYASGATDVRTQITKLKNSGIDALFVSPQTETSSEIVLSQMEQLNFKPKLFVNDIVFGATNLIAKHKVILEGALGGNYIVRSEKLQNTLDTYKAKYGLDCVHINACAVAYDTMNILADAIRKNGNTAEGVKNYLKTLNYDGASGNTSFDENNDRSGVGYSLSVISNGRVEPVK